MNMQRNHVSFRRNSEFRRNFLMFQYTKLHSCQDAYLPMPAGAPLGVSRRDRGPWKCTELTGGTVRARSLLKFRHYGTGRAQSFRSFSAPKNWHMTAHGTGGSAAAGQGRLSGLLTLTAQAVPDISRQTFITFRPWCSLLTLTKSSVITAIMDWTKRVTITVCRNKTTHTHWIQVYMWR